MALPYPSIASTSLYRPGLPRCASTKPRRPGARTRHDRGRARERPMVFQRPSCGHHCQGDGSWSLPRVFPQLINRRGARVYTPGPIATTRGCTINRQPVHLQTGPSRSQYRPGRAMAAPAGTPSPYPAQGRRGLIHSAPTYKARRQEGDHSSGLRAVWREGTPTLDSPIGPVVLWATPPVTRLAGRNLA